MMITEKLLLNFRMKINLGYIFLSFVRRISDKKLMQKNSELEGERKGGKGELNYKKNLNVRINGDCFEKILEDIIYF